jgi:hypothetical protein
MKVKIDNQIFDANEQPIALIFEDNENIEKTIENMGQMINNDSKVYCIYPKGMDVKEIKEFIKNTN